MKRNVRQQTYSSVIHATQGAHIQRAQEQLSKRLSSLQLFSAIYLTDSHLSVLLPRQREETNAPTDSECKPKLLFWKFGVLKTEEKNSGSLVLPAALDS